MLTMQAYRGRGRPRPKETIELDARVLDLVRAHGGQITRNQVAQELGLSASKAWLSLARLRNAGLLVQRSSGKRAVWCTPGAETEGQ